MKRTDEYITLSEAFNRGIIELDDFCQLIIRTMSSGIIVTRNEKGVFHLSSADQFVTSLTAEYETRHELHQSTLLSLVIRLNCVRAYKTLVTVVRPMMRLKGHLKLD